MSNILEEIKKNVISGKVDIDDEGYDGKMAGKPGVIELVKKAIEEKVPASDILSKAITPGMEEVGRRFESGDYIIPDMLASAECVQEATTFLEPLLAEDEAENRGNFVIATVEGDMHDIGKNIVATILNGSGFKVTDLGTDVKPEKIVSAAKEFEAKFIGLSALLTTTMEGMSKVIELLNKEGLRDNVKVCIGGAPVSQDFAKKIGADLYAEDAFDAIHKLEELS